MGALNILAIAGPIWLGDNGSVTKKVIERLYGCPGLMNVRYSLQHLGYTILPQADVGWIARWAPDRRTGTPVRVIRRTTSPTATHLHDLEPDAPGRHALARQGHPAHGNQRSEWDAGCRFDAPNPDYR